MGPIEPSALAAVDQWDAGWQARAQQAHLDVKDAYERGYERGQEDAGSPIMLGLVILMCAAFIFGVVIGALLGVRLS
jgi:hypothetical protein